MKPAPKIFCSDKSLNFHGLFVLAVIFLISACATPPKQSGVTTTGSAHPKVAKRDYAGAEIEKRLREEYRHWNGTRHPRAQVGQGQPVPFGKLRAGDLVFFKPPSYPRHVGIYLGGSEFVHASKNKGVTLSKIDRYYWGKYYWTARRILPAFKHP
jgi:hypothetical protein